MVCLQFGVKNYLILQKRERRKRLKRLKIKVQNSLWNAYEKSKRFLPKSDYAKCIDAWKSNKAKFRIACQLITRPERNVQMLNS